MVFFSSLKCMEGLKKNYHHIYSFANLDKKNVTVLTPLMTEFYNNINGNKTSLKWHKNDS